MTKILVIEDDESIRASIVDILTLSDYEVEAAIDGVDGVAKAQAYDPDIILCDVMMPKLDGHGVLEEIKKIPSLSRVPFMFLTAKSNIQDIREGMLLGADDYLPKPFSGDELLSAIQTRLERHAQSQKYDIQQMEAARQYINLTLPHELRTPLTTIMGYVEILDEEVDNMDSDMIHSMLASVRGATGRLSHLIENYVAYGQLQLLLNDPEVIQEIRNNSLVHGFDGLIAQSAEQVAYHVKRINDLVLDVESVSACISFEHAKKILEEIMSNAFKFSPDGTPVTIIGKINNDRYVVSITNHGRGMTAEQIANIKVNNQFERDIYEQQGAGLGLVIAQQILDIHGGDLIIESEPDVTTSVHMVLRMA